MGIKITNEEKKILKKLISTYNSLYSEIEELELQIEEASKQQEELRKEYDKVSSKLLSTRSEEYMFFQKLKLKYPALKNLKELIE